MPLSDIYRNRERIAEQLGAAMALSTRERKQVIDAIRSRAKCYAGLLGTMRAGHKGYAHQFEVPKLFPGRMAKAARWGEPNEDEVAGKPWLQGCPRLIFVSDMGDALSRGVPFDFLEREIIQNVVSRAGSRHVWLWVTKRPKRMAKFGDWLGERGISWPENLVPMTTITSMKVSGRVDALRKIPSRFKGLSCEPLFGPVNLDLAGIDWVIAGGGSDTLAEPFDVEWALQLRAGCRTAGGAFFLKQLGRNPFLGGSAIVLDDKHGGDWNEWPEDWRVREVPPGFKREAQKRATGARPDWHLSTKT
jgi:protein gp37